MVTPAHRGHGLGRAVKAHVLRWLLADRPALESVETGTDAANAPMIRVNEQLGFVTDREVVVVSRSL
jgi:RimJ/RimL family protein N-acetyltransferase